MGPLMPLVLASSSIAVTVLTWGIARALWRAREGASTFLGSPHARPSDPVVPPPADRGVRLDPRSSCIRHRRRLRVRRPRPYRAAS